MGAAAVPVMVIGSIISAIGNIAQGQAQASAYREQARIAEQNAVLAESEGFELMRRGAVAEYQLRGEAGRTLGAQQAAYGASGVAGGTGSAASVEFGSRLALELDAAALRFSTANERYAKQVEAWTLRRQARAARKAAGAASIAGFLGAAGTLLTGLGQVDWDWGGGSSA